MTRIRLVEPEDAAALSTHMGRDAESLARWQPAQPAEYGTADGQAGRIDRLLDAHRRGQIWPGVVLADANGFSPIGVARSHTFVAGAWRDAVLWELTLDG